MAFEIAPCKVCSKSYPCEQSDNVALQLSLPQRDAPATQTYYPRFDTIC
jgi:hypothetical protein